MCSLTHELTHRLIKIDTYCVVSLRQHRPALSLQMVILIGKSSRVCLGIRQFLPVVGCFLRISQCGVRGHRTEINAMTWNGQPLAKRKPLNVGRWNHFEIIGLPKISKIQPIRRLQDDVCNWKSIRSLRFQKVSEKGKQFFRSGNLGDLYLMKPVKANKLRQPFQ